LKPLNIYRTSIRPLWNLYQTSIIPLLYHYRTSNVYHYQTSIKLLLNIYQILIHFMKYNTDIMYRADIASYTRKNREKSIFYLTHYTYWYIMKLHHINILNNYQIILTTIEHLSNVYQTIIKPLNIYQTSIESQSNISH